MVAFDFAVHMVDGAAVRAFDAAVGFDGQEDAGVAAPCFIVRAAAIQGKVVRGQGNGLGLFFAHCLCPFGNQGLCMGCVIVRYKRLAVHPFRRPDGVVPVPAVGWDKCRMVPV